MIEVLNKPKVTIEDESGELKEGKEEGNANVENQDETIVVKVSLHDMLRLTQHELLKVKCIVKGRTNVSLIDRGRTHNFIHEKTTSRTCLKIVPLDNFHFFVINKSTMKCKGMI